MRRVTLRHLLCMGMGRASCGLWGDRYDRLRRDFAASPAASDMRAVAERFAHPWLQDVAVQLAPDMVRAVRSGP